MPQRRLRLLQAVSLNMSMMVGIGPFLTIPGFVEAIGSRRVAAAWAVVALIALCDGLVWSELASAFPGAGGTYHYYDAVYGESRVGRLLKFLFVWQFLFSAPLELATGAVGLARHLSYFAPAIGRTAWSWAGVPVAWSQVAAMGVMMLVTLLAYRRVESAGRLMVVLWIGMLATVAWVIAAGLSRFDPAVAFGTPAGVPPIRGLGLALTIGMYDLLGYYQVCYLGDDVAEPEKTLPRSIVISVGLVALIYLALTLSVLGVIPHGELISSPHVASDLILKRQGPGAAAIVTVMIMWTAAAATFAGLLGYSQVPYASAKAGHFFRAFAMTHPTGGFPHRSLLLVGGLTALACLLDLETVISGLLASRIAIQFLGQVATLFVIRRRGEAERPRTFRMPLFPLPALVASAGWLFILGTSTRVVLAYGLGSLGLGVAAFAVRDRLWARDGSGHSS